MSGWKQYLYSVIVSALACGIVTRMVQDPKRKELIRLVCGMVLMITILRPLSGIRPDILFQMAPEARNAASFYVTEGARAASEARAECIKASCEAYILDKAKQLGVAVEADISLDEALIPVFAEMIVQTDDPALQQLESILTTDLGIPKEHQKWIRKPESNS